MNLCLAYPVFIILSVASGGAIAHFTDTSVLYGIFIGLAVGLAPLGLLGIINVLMMAWCPDRPICKCGKCRSMDYKNVGPEEMTLTEETVFEYQCPFCSRTYKQKDKRFLEISSDGCEIPYMVISKQGRWRNESTESPIQ
jgi:hypothetical protein